MGDIWAFLLQTLTASGAAVLLLIMKAMFRDKLSPRWQFAIWGVLGLVLLIPAGFTGRYALLNWPLFVESIKTLLAGSYTLTRVILPFPLLTFKVPGNIFDWLFVIYRAGVVIMLIRYLFTYIRLRIALREGVPAGKQYTYQIQNIANQYKLPTCRVVEVVGLSSAFICGIFRPILVLPASADIDDKIFLHELLHLKHRDVLWGLVICLFRCIHWCNPLLWYCADHATNDLESLCDQRVLELLEGEERRNYGRILLSMSNDKYARVPGTSSMANGGKNIRQRIQSIAHFKKYPAGMALVSICVAIILSASLLLGTQADSVYNAEHRFPSNMDLDIALASARTVRCTTPAGALDAYGKAILAQSGIYRAMCAPLNMQSEIAEQMHQQEDKSSYPLWDSGLECYPNTKTGYFVYNLEPVGKNAYEGLLAVELNYPPDGQPSEPHKIYLAIQTVRTEKENNRWVIIPQEEFQTLAVEANRLEWGIPEFPTYIYSGKTDDMQVEVHLQKTFLVNNTVTEADEISAFLGADTYFDSIPKPSAEFDTVHYTRWSYCTYIGDETDKSEIYQLGISSAPLLNKKDRPVLPDASGTSSGSSSNGECWGGITVSEDWGPSILIGGGGTNTDYSKDAFDLPYEYAADLYINGNKAAELNLNLQEGGPQ